MKLQGKGTRNETKLLNNYRTRSKTMSCEATWNIQPQIPITNCRSIDVNDKNHYRHQIQN